MKNKKLFAILTLVCFMFTLMPVAAFAADEVTYTVGTVEVEGGIAAEVVASKEVTFKDLDLELYSGSKLLTTMSLEKEYTTDTISGVLYTDATKHNSSWSQTTWAATADVAPTKVVAYVDGKKVAEEAVTVADWSKVAGVVDIATAGNIDDATSTFVAEDGNQSVKKGEKVVFELDVEDKAYNPAAGTVFIWAEETAGKASSALTVDGAKAAGIDNVWAVAVNDYADVKVAFSRAGEYTVYAAPFVTIASADTNEVTEFSKFDCEFSVIKVKSGSVDPELAYKANGYAVDSVIAKVNNVVPNNVFGYKQEVVFTNDGQPMKGKTIAIETNSAAIEVSKASDVTNSQGEIDFEIAASVEGTYEVILSVDGVEWTIEVTVGNTAAVAIETATAPTAPIALYSTWENDEIEFYVTDINGNAVENFSGMSEIEKQNEKYVVLTEAPADSDLESDDLYLTGGKDGIYGLAGVKMDAEGTYAVKVILDNGAFATAKWEVKKFQTPVQLVIGTSTDVVELGGKIGGELLYFDANGVQKAAKDAEIAVAGYAVKSVVGNQEFQVVAKSDEKYVGATITVTAVSEKYDLVATKNITVADGAVAINIVDKAADVNVNNKLTWNVVDSEGTRVALGAGATVEDIKYVVLDKPADAKVSVSDATTLKDLNNKGIGKLSLTSNKIGNVTVQVVLKASYNDTDTQTKQVKYYTGAQIIAVGTQSVGDVVVMSIGSNEIVKNDVVATIPAAPIVENNRTFVPFRALAEAFGATVAYDEATQAVTAELNGVTVVMTIGSAEYTVNGEAKTADVAPFINGSRTMVPVRFAAEAFGIKVIPTYDENGATADILFNL